MSVSSLVPKILIAVTLLNSVALAQDDAAPAPRRPRTPRIVPTVVGEGVGADPSQPVPTPTPQVLAPVREWPLPEATRKLEQVQLKDLPLPDAVALLQEQMRELGMEPLNVLFGADTRALIVPEVKLRNVSGSEALQLFAAASGCRLEPMYSDDARGIGSVPGRMPVNPWIIGYRFLPEMRQHNQLPGFGGQPASARPGATVASATGRVTRIYSLGPITTFTKIPEIEKSLRDILAVDGVSADQVSLALHERTNVLVVSAKEEVHALVEQLVTALSRNASDADRERTAREKAAGREDLEATQRMTDRLKKELDARDEEMNQLRAQLSKLSIQMEQEHSGVMRREEELQKLRKELDKVQDTPRKPAGDK